MLDLSKELGPLERVLDLTALRQRVIGQNIANQNTPGYTRQVVSFEEELDGSFARIGDVTPRVTEDLVTERKADGNNVQLEEEVMAMEKNQVLQDLFTRALGASFRKYLSAIRGR